VLGFCALVVLGALGVFAFVGVVTPTRVTVTLAPTPTVLTGSAPATTVTHDGLTVEASKQQNSGAVTIKLTNQGTHSAPYNALDFQLEDDTDHVRHDAADVFFPTSSGSGSIVPGAILAGTIVFRVPANEHRFTLVWTPTVAVPITG
jgi:Domain of unknown function (DUF4352)